MEATENVLGQIEIIFLRGIVSKDFAKYWEATQPLKVFFVRINRRSNIGMNDAKQLTCTYHLHHPLVKKENPLDPFFQQYMN